jgi:uncharacterized protein YciI
MLFACLSFYKPDAGPARAEARDAHLAYLRDATLPIQAGPLLDEDGGNAAAFIIVEADDIETVRRFHAGDPFTKAGVFDRVHIHRWRKDFG